MKLIKPSVEVINEPDIMKRIEICGRVAYQSEDKMCDGSDEKFFNALVKRGHESVLEHSRIVVKTNRNKSTKYLRRLITEYENYSGLPSYIRNCGNFEIKSKFDDNIWSGNLRAWRNIAKRFYGEPIIYNLFHDNKLFADIPFDDTYLFPYNKKECDAEVITFDPLHRDAHEYITFKCVMSRATANELVRHRLLGITQSSTRYINYSEEVPYVEAWWMREDHSIKEEDFYIASLMQNESSYKNAFSVDKPQPQKSRFILASETAATICITGTIEYFKNIVIPLRTAAGAHPDIRCIADMMNVHIQNMKGGE